MTDPNSIDVLVVGLGPAGASAAAAAARAGVRILGIDRKAIAGLPVQCAEFVPAMLGQDKAVMAQSWRQAILSMTTFVETQSPHVKEQFPGHMIDRAAFDSALVDAARVAGAACEFGVVLRGIDGEGHATLSDGRIVAPRVVIGADGPHSVVGAAIGQVNVEIAETRQIAVPLLQRFEATDIFLSGEIPGGYAWLFPKCDSANLGLGVAPPWRHRLKPLLDGLHARLLAEGRVAAQVLSHTGGAIPVGGMRDPVGMLGSMTVLLAGDAAGLTNPVTGAGINPAVQSGAMAGSAAGAIVRGDGHAAHDYAEALADTFAVSLDRALARRRALMQTFAADRVPTAHDLQRAWIAFPEYWAA